MKKTKTGFMDWTLLLIVLVLVVLGLIMQYSASSYNISLVIRQAEYAGVGFIFIIVMSLLPAGLFYKLSLPAFGLALAFTILAGLAGKVVNGARRWFELGPLTFQPSELLKVGVIMACAMVICKYYSQIHQAEYLKPKECWQKLRSSERGEFLQERKGYLFVLLLIVAAAGAVAVFNKDMGTGVIIFAIGYVMMLVMSPRVSWLLGLLGVVFAAMVGLVAAFPYRMGRITSWLFPDRYTQNLGYQIKEAMYAIGSGGWLGRGLGKSVQKEIIPEPHTDMIYSIVCEELGIIGGIALIGLFVFLILRLKKNYNETGDLYGKMIIAGVTTHIWVQTLINMAVLTGLLPNTGVPLPFISYGGTSLFCLLLEIGLVMSVRKSGIDRSAK